MPKEKAAAEKKHKHPLPTKLREWFFYPVVRGSWYLGKALYRLTIRGSKALYLVFRDAKGTGERIAKSEPVQAVADEPVPLSEGKPKPQTLLKKVKSNPGKPFYEPLEAVNTAAGSFSDFSQSLKSRSQIVLIFGKRGSGKSTLGFKLMENIAAKSNRPAFVIGVSQELLPDWITEVSSLTEVDNNGIVLVDEGALEFSSRESMRGKNVSLGKLLATARHKDLSLFFITQNTGMIDKGVLNLTDMVLAKEGSLLQKQMERPVIKNFVENADTAIKQFPKNERVKYCYIFTDDFEGLCKIPQPSFWSEDVSKSHRDEK